MAKGIALDQIYEAAFDDEAFAGIASGLAHWLGARSALIHWVHKDGATEILSHSGYFTDEQLGLYAREFAPIDPWMQATATPEYANRVSNLEEIVPVADFIRTDFYNDYVRAIGDDTCRGIGIRLENDWGSGFVALQRGLEQTAFEASSVGLLARNLQHVRRMLSIRGKVAATRHRSETLAGALDAMGQPVLIVDAQLRLQYANAAGEEMLTSNRVFEARGGLLRSGEPRNESLLRVAVAKACRPQGGEASSVALAAPDGAGVQLTVTAAPPRGGATPLALILAEPQRGAEASRAPRLRALYGLSETEAALALLLAEGATPTEIADRRGVAVDTVRAQIKRIAFKLGCSRQSDIVRIVSRLPSVFTSRHLP